MSDTRHQIEAAKWSLDVAAIQSPFLHGDTKDLGAETFRCRPRELNICSR